MKTKKKNKRKPTELPNIRADAGFVSNIKNLLKHYGYTKQKHQASRGAKSSSQ